MEQPNFLDLRGLWGSVMEVLFKEKFVSTKKPHSVIAPRSMLWELFIAIVMYGYISSIVTDPVSVKVVWFILGGMIMAVFFYIIRLLEALVRKQEADLSENTNRPLRLPREAATPE